MQVIVVFKKETINRKSVVHIDPPTKMHEAIFFTNVQRGGSVS